MKHKLVRIPNCFIDLFPKAAELKLASALYSLINSNTERDMMDNYVISVSQKALAKLCGCSEITISRAASKLRSKGFIVSQTRPTSSRRAANGALMLDKYTYTIKAYSRDTRYFCVDRSNLCKVQGQAFRVYMLFAKLSDSFTRAFYHSLTDLCKDTSLKVWTIGRKELSRTIKLLCKRKLIRKIRKRTTFGDFTENTYVLISHHSLLDGAGGQREKIPIKEISPCVASQGTDKPKTKFKSDFVGFIIYHITGFVKRIKEKTIKIFDFFDFWGSG